jgi:hypothetical protein
LPAGVALRDPQRLPARLQSFPEGRAVGSAKQLIAGVHLDPGGSAQQLESRVFGDQGEVHREGRTFGDLDLLHVGLIPVFLDAHFM